MRSELNKKPANGNNDSKIGTVLGRSKWIALLGVCVLYISSGILVSVGIIELYYIVIDILQPLKEYNRINTIFLSAKFIHIIEIYLLAIIFYIFAVGIFKLFVGKFVLLGWYKIESLDDMKAELAKAVVIFLSVYLVQKIVDIKGPENILYSSISIALTCANLIWYIRSLKNNKTNTTNI